MEVSAVTEWPTLYLQIDMFEQQFRSISKIDFMERYITEVRSLSFQGEMLSVGGSESNPSGETESNPGCESELNSCCESESIQGCESEALKSESSYESEELKSESSCLI